MKTDKEKENKRKELGGNIGKSTGTILWLILVHVPLLAKVVMSIAKNYGVLFLEDLSYVSMLGTFYIIASVRSLMISKGSKIKEDVVLITISLLILWGLSYIPLIFIG